MTSLPIMALDGGLCDCAATLSLSEWRVYECLSINTKSLRRVAGYQCSLCVSASVKDLDLVNVFGVKHSLILAPKFCVKMNPSCALHQQTFDKFNTSSASYGPRPGAVVQDVRSTHAWPSSAFCWPCSPSFRRPASPSFCWTSTSKSTWLSSRPPSGRALWRRSWSSSNSQRHLRTQIRQTFRCTCKRHSSKCSEIFGRCVVIPKVKRRNAETM